MIKEVIAILEEVDYRDPYSSDEIRVALLEEAVKRVLKILKAKTIKKEKI